MPHSRRYFFTKEPAMDDTTVNIPLAKYDALRKEATDNGAKVLELEKALAEAQLGNGDDHAPRLASALRSALSVVQFAVGNLEPATIAGWPHEDLRVIANAIESTPTLQDDTDIRPLAEELRLFADTAKGYEEYRAERRKQNPPIPATPGDFGPQTAEATVIHAAIQGKHNRDASVVPPGDPNPAPAAEEA